MFMATPEAIQLVLPAASRKERRGRKFIVDMGLPMKIVDLPHDLIHSYGSFEEQIRFVFSVRRPG